MRIKCISGPAILIFMLTTGVVFTLDFGLILNDTPEYSTDGFTNTLGAVPWFSTPVGGPLGEKTSLYVSGSLDLEYKNNAWKPVPKAGRTEFTFHPLPAMTIKAGRVNFSDSLGIIASGLFDGLSGSLGIKGTRLSLDVFYTGLLYKKSAEIKLTNDDELYYNDGDVYFASRRILGSIRWEIPELFDAPVSVALDGLVQFDLNCKDTSLHSQYLTAQAVFPLIRGLDMSLGAAAALAEPDAGDPLFSLAGSVGLIWQPPTAWQDLFSLTALWSSGTHGDTLGPFLPVTGVPQGRIFDPTLSGLMTIKAHYTLSLLSTLSVSADAGYFLRTDLQTLSDSYYYAYTEPDSYALGAEFFGSVIWAPVSDIQALLNGGAFFPGLGDSLNSDAPIRGKISLGLIISL
jgi:hypothetical protein